jgi:hypothetical protein
VTEAGTSSSTATTSPYGEKREVLAYVRNSDLGAAKPVLAVDGFNVAHMQLP